MSKAKYLIIGSFLVPVLLVLLGSQIGIGVGGVFGSFYWLSFIMIHIPLTLLMSDHLKTARSDANFGTREFWIVFTLMSGVVSVAAYWVFNHVFREKN